MTDLRLKEQAAQDDRTPDEAKALVDIRRKVKGALAELSIALHALDKVLGR